METNDDVRRMRQSCVKIMFGADVRLNSPSDGLFPFSEHVQNDTISTFSEGANLSFLQSPGEQSAL